MWAPDQIANLVLTDNRKRQTNGKLDTKSLMSEAEIFFQ